MVLGCKEVNCVCSRQSRKLLFCYFLLSLGSSESYQAFVPSFRPPRSAAVPTQASFLNSHALRPQSMGYDCQKRAQNPRTTTLTAHSSSAVAERNVEGARATRNNKRIRRNNQQPANGNQFMTDSMLNHEILSKPQELKLARSVQAAKQLEKPLEELLQQKQAERIDSFSALSYEDSALLEDAFQQQQQSSSDEDMIDLAVYGGGRSEPSVFGTEDEDGDDYSEGFSFLGADDLRLEQQDRRSLVSAALSAANDNKSSSGGDAQLQDLIHDVDRLLTDKDVKTELNLKGGLKELRSVLLKGALARDKLVRHNFRLVMSIAKRWCRGASTGSDAALGASAYAGSWDRPSLDEVVQEGVLGLMTAADRFDPERGVRFSTYATPWVTNHVRRCFQAASTGMRVPVGYHDIKNKYQSRVKLHFDTNGDVPPMNVLADELGISLKRLQFVLRMTKSPLSLDAPLNSGVMTKAGGSGSLGDNQLLLTDLLEENTELSPEEQLERSFLRQSLETAMARELAPYERDIVRLRLGLDDGVRRTHRQVAEDWCGGSLSSSEVRSAEQRAYQKLRSPHALSTYHFLSYLDLAGVDGNAIQMR